MLRSVYGPKRKEVTEGRRKLHSTSMHNNLYGYSWPYIDIITLKLKREMNAIFVTYTKNEKSNKKLSQKTWRGRDYFHDLHVYGRIL
jgi:hypothetical protein